MSDDRNDFDLARYRAAQANAALESKVRHPAGHRAPRVVPKVRETEKGFQEAVLDYAVKVGHWDLRYHTQRSEGSTPGFPDWVLVRDRVVFVELKGDGGKLTVAQANWITRLVNAGAEAYVWWPDDWDTVVRVLR